jgi:hypothetical protein
MEGQKIISVDTLRYYNDKIVEYIDNKSNVSAVDTNDVVEDVETNNIYVKYVAQTLTDEQKKQTRNNIGAISASDITKKQDRLISGTNIKTINGNSILGKGNINVIGAYPIGNLIANTTNVLNPNTFYIYEEVVDNSLDIDFAAGVDGVANEYIFQFATGSTAPTVSFPDNIKWISPLNIEPNKRKGGTNDETCSSSGDRMRLYCQFGPHPVVCQE